MTSCPVCGVQFKPSHTGRPQRFCSATCRYKGGSVHKLRPTEPKVCACLHSRRPSPWHCPALGCGKWKRSTDALCGHCDPNVSLVKPTTLKEIDLAFEEYWQAVGT